MTPSLPLFAQLRRYTLAVIAAAETAADFAAVIYTDTPAETEDQPTVMETFELEKRMATVLPDGWRLGQIDEERRVLEEIRDSLASEEQALARRLTSAREEKDRLAEKIASFTRRGVEMGGELEELEREIAILDRRHSENTARERDLAVEIASAQEDLAAARNEISHVSEELEMDRTVLTRMDRKLSLGGPKR